MTGIPPKSFAVLYSELERWSVDYFRRIEWQWPPELIQPIGHVVQLKKVEVDHQVKKAQLPIIEKISFGGQISVSKPERRIKYKGRLFWADAGDMIYSKIRVKQGSLAIIPRELERIAVSTEYPVFTINPNKAYGRYLELVIRSDVFMHLMDGLSHGGSTKTRIPPDELKKQTIPIPPIEIQKAIVSAWEQAKSHISSIQERISALEKQIEVDFLAALGLKKIEKAVLPRVFGIGWKDLARWSVMYNQLASISVDISSGRFPVSMLGDISTVSYGIQKCPANRPGQHARPYLRVANVQRGELDLSEIKRINVPDSDMQSFRLEPGDLLFVEGNGSRNELGRCAIWNGKIEDCVHQNHILKVRPNPAKLQPDFAMTWFNTSVGKDHFFRNVKTSSGLGTINSTELRAAPIALPPVSVQKVLMKKVETQRKMIEQFKIEAEKKSKQAKADIEAMILGSKSVPKPE
jgi:type I restriction enzyme, S subunit